MTWSELAGHLIACATGIVVGITVWELVARLRRRNRLG